MPIIPALERLRIESLRPSQVTQGVQSSLDSIETLSQKLKKKLAEGQWLAHTCNPSYSGGRDQEDHGLKPAQANSSQDPILRKLITKWVGEVAQGVGPEFKPQYCNK
jgi:hypothetical protein